MWVSCVNSARLSPLLPMCHTFTAQHERQRWCPVQAARPASTPSAHAQLFTACRTPGDAVLRSRGGYSHARRVPEKGCYVPPSGKRPRKWPSQGPPAAVGERYLTASLGWPLGCTWPTVKAFAFLCVDSTQRSETGQVQGLRWHNRPREREGKECGEADGHRGLRRKRPREGKGGGRGKVRARRKRKVKGW